MKKVLEIFIFVFVSVFLFGGCAQLKQYLPGSETFLQQDDSNYLLSCLKEFEETGADLLITACPYCRDQFQRILPPEKRDQVRDLIELVDRQTD